MKIKLQHSIIAVLFLSVFSFHLSSLKAQVLYEISGNSAKHKSYLLATNRLVDMQFLDTIPNVFKCFGKCNRVVTEFAMQDYEAIAALRQAALLPDSIKLSNFYPVFLWKHGCVLIRIYYYLYMSIR